MPAAVIHYFMLTRFFVYNLSVIEVDAEYKIMNITICLPQITKNKHGVYPVFKNYECLNGNVSLPNIL